MLGEWEHFLYVGKIAFFGWVLHYGADFGTYLLVPFDRCWLMHRSYSAILSYGTRNLRAPLRAFPFTSFILSSPTPVF